MKLRVREIEERRTKCGKVHRKVEKKSRYYANGKNTITANKFYN